MTETKAAMLYDATASRSFGEKLEENMKTKYTVALSMLAGVALGAVSVGGLYAQGKAPGAYAIVTYTEIADPAAYKANVSDKTPAMIEKAGGHLLVATSDITVLREGTPPFPIKRIAVIGFDSIQQAKDWYASPDRKDIQAYVNQNTKGRAFAVKAN
jgi:uncharacterized protein (DUF1330 family)